MSNDLIREELIEFLIDNKVMQLKFSELTGLSQTTISYFLQGKRDIAKKHLITIHNYITSKK